jgi:hypothetical protein
MAWFWKIVNLELNRGESLYGANYLRIKFEDLFAKDGSGLQQLTDWIGLPRSAALSAEANRENVNASRKQILPRWDEWDTASRSAVLEHCGELMSYYGYRESPAGAAAPAGKELVPLKV